MIDQHEIDRSQILDLLEQTSDTVLRRVIRDCLDIIERRLDAFNRITNYGVSHGTHDER